MKFLKSDRCSICKTYRGNRFCLRIGKSICWHCCNESRVDFKCSTSCAYALEKVEKADNLFGYKSKVDSKAEYSDLLKNQIKVWSRKPQELFKGKIPYKMIRSAEGKQELEKFFNRLPIKKQMIIQNLKNELKLANLKDAKSEISHEDIAQDFLDQIIEQNWKGTTKFLLRNSQYESEKYLHNYIARISSNKVLKKIKKYDLLASAMTGDGKKALVYFEVNGKIDLTISLFLAGKKWKIEKKFFGKTELYNGETETFKQVAALLSQNKMQKTFELLKNYSKIFVDSADLHYYWGLYYIFTKRNVQAKRYFFNAVEIDPDFTEAQYNLAYILQSENMIEEAKQLYQQILKIDPDEPKTLNNLASILIDEEKFEEAENMLEKCLKAAPDFEVAKKNLQRIER